MDKKKKEKRRNDYLPSAVQAHLKFNRLLSRLCMRLPVMKTVATYNLFHPRQTSSRIVGFNESAANAVNHSITSSLDKRPLQMSSTWTPLGHISMHNIDRQSYPTRVCMH